MRDRRNGRMLWLFFVKLLGSGVIIFKIKLMVKILYSLFILSGVRR